MKKLTFLLLFTCVSSLLFAQNAWPSVKLKDLSGREVPFDSLLNRNDTAVIVSLWATWCVPCIQELENISDQYEDRRKETPFTLLAVSIDDSRTATRVKSFVKGKGWPYLIYLDINSELKRALNINDVPHILVFKHGKIVYQHSGYVAGNEEELFENLKSL
ncbi:MAG: TlpA disulfide reductase family protein [Chitinophagaceae bacterium]